MNVGGNRNETEITANDLSTAYTQEFLDCCRRHGIKLVSIHTRTSLIKGCAENPFTAFGNVFADEREGGWPAIWSVVDELGISFGCGNGGQHQIAPKIRLISGVYRLKDGEWTRLSDDEV